MEKDALLKEWAHKIVDVAGDDAIGETEYDDILNVLESVYDVGFEAGKDAQKLEVQLNRKPEISNTEPGAI